MTADKVALVGCGVIAPTYAHTLIQFESIDLIAAVDEIPERAQALADKFNLPIACNFAEVLDDESISAIVNLTPPLAHNAVTAAALRAGKHVFSEKPLGVDLEEGRSLIALAAERGLRLGCAPDTFLGQGLQTCIDVIERGLIGEPIGANGFLMHSGPELWHPHPDIFYLRGAGPMLDVGPYYLTALVQMLGPATRISGVARITRPTRTIKSEPRAGEVIPVEVPTHVCSMLEFGNGAIGSLVTSFDIQASRFRNIEIYGTEATLSVPDPNNFGGKIRIRGASDLDWQEIPSRPSSIPQSRGIGAADMLWALRTGREHRATGDLALHVLELMTGAITSSEEGKSVEIKSTFTRPPLLPTDLDPNCFDD